MNQLSFGYIPDRKIIDNISFDLQSGNKACIMGTDGSGKSTIIKLLTGSYHNFEGSITVEGVPIGNYDPDSIRSETGILFNQQDIFHGTLFENIALGNTAISTDEIMKLAEKIGLKDFIISSKNGFDTEIEPTGRRLSSGTVRKILLLRALVGNPRLLLLEEPWFGFDENCQQLIKQYILTELPSTTVIIITNDEMYARSSDLVLVMNNGTISKQGKPNEVL
jgi:ABC-type bacteriocin/lantibiotic exporter with double-glycine peptidase domain